MNNEKIVILLISFELLCCIGESNTNSDDQTNPCDNFNGHQPGSILHQCPQAKFMSSEDFECYDKSSKDQ